jgi:hypothetical protein
MPELEQVRIVAQSQISDLASEAETAPRRRTHLLLHSGPQDQVQRLMIVLQPEPTFARIITRSNGSW